MPESHTFVIDQPAKLLAFLLEHVTDVKRTTVKQCLSFGSVFVNRKSTTRYDHPLVPGDIVHIDTNQRRRAELKGFQLTVIHEDRDIIVIEKPAGLLTVATEGERRRTAYRQLTAYVGAQKGAPGARVFIVHRLDRETSGLLVFARTEAAKRVLQDRWETVEKRYYAVVEGTPPEKEATITSHLRESKSLKVHSGHAGGDAKPAITKYKVERVGKEYSLLEVTTATGRKNQIRAHLAEIGFPIAGDEKYAGHSNTARRLGLHACKLSFTHPTTGKRLTFTSELPEPLKRLVGTAKSEPEVKPDARKVHIEIRKERAAVQSERAVRRNTRPAATRDRTLPRTASRGRSRGPIRRR